MILARKNARAGKEVTISRELVTKVFGAMMNSRRQARMLKIRELWIESFATRMGERGKQHLLRRITGGDMTA